MIFTLYLWNSMLFLRFEILIKGEKTSSHFVVLQRLLLRFKTIKLWSVYIDSWTDESKYNWNKKYTKLNFKIEKYANLNEYFKKNTLISFQRVR